VRRCGLGNPRTAVIETRFSVELRPSRDLDQWYSSPEHHHSAPQPQLRRCAGISCAISSFVALSQGGILPPPSPIQTPKFGFLCWLLAMPSRSAFPHLPVLSRQPGGIEFALRAARLDHRVPYLNVDSSTNTSGSPTLSHLHIFADLQKNANRRKPPECRVKFFAPSLFKMTQVRETVPERTNDNALLLLLPHNSLSTRLSSSPQTRLDPNVLFEMSYIRPPSTSPSRSRASSASAVHQSRVQRPKFSSVDLRSRESSQTRYGLYTSYEDLEMNKVERSTIKPRYVDESYLDTSQSNDDLTPQRETITTPPLESRPQLTPSTNTSSGRYVTTTEFVP
jgi:hypothetical protein